jgi:hypothetical protein
MRGVRFSVRRAVVVYALWLGFTLIARFDLDRYDRMFLHGISLRIWLLAAFGFGLVVAFFSAIKAVPRDPADAASPHAVLTRDRSATLALAFGVLLVAGVVVGLEAELAARIATGFWGGLWGGAILGFGFGFALGVGLSWGFRIIESQMAWPLYIVTRAWLALRRWLPWRFMDFLADAHQRGVLRQVGAVYQFRHIELQHRLADRSNLATWTGEAGDAAPNLLAARPPIREWISAAEHPDTLTARGNLATSAGQRGDAAGARDRWAALLPIRERVSGAEHPDTLITRGNLANWTGEAGDAAGARDQYAALLSILERVSGAEHPDTLTVRGNLAYWARQADEQNSN